MRGGLISLLATGVSSKLIDESVWTLCAIGVELLLDAFSGVAVTLGDGMSIIEAMSIMA